MRRAALLILLAAHPVSAQVRDTAGVVRLRPVEISVTRAITTDLRTAAAVTVISRSEIQRGQPTVGLDEALAIVPGVIVNNRYNFALGSRIAIRGLGARAAFGVRGVRLMVDGIPLTMPDGQANVNNVDLGSAGRIEVLRGPASSLYGNAAGGVISIETETPPAGPFTVDLRSVIGDLGRDDLTRLVKHQAKLSGRRADLDYIVSVGRLEADGYRNHSRAEQSSLNARVRVGAAERTRLTAVLNYADAPVAQNPGSLPVDSANRTPEMAWPRNAATLSGEAASQLQGGLALEHRLGSGALRLSGHALTRSLENPLPFGYIALDRQGGGVRASYALPVLRQGTQLTIGGDFEIQKDERTEHDNVLGKPGTQLRRDQTDRVSTFGPFAQLELVLNRLTLTGGLRYDRIAFETEDRFRGDLRDDSGERTLSAVSPRLAALYALSESSSLYASFSTAFQTPTTTELINRPPLPGQACCVGGFNEELEPQRALNFEAGFKGHWAAHALRYEAVAYTMRVEDALIPFQVGGQEGREFFRNAGETRQRGLEFGLGLAPRDWLGFDASYTYSDFSFTDDGFDAVANDGNAVPGVAPHHWFGRVRLQPRPAVALELEHEYTGSYYANDANTAENRAAHITDARLLFDLRVAGLETSPFIAVNNLRNVRYNGSVVVNAAGARFFEPAPGRNLYIGLGLRFRG